MSFPIVRRIAAKAAIAPASAGTATSTPSPADQPAIRWRCHGPAEWMGSRQRAFPTATANSKQCLGIGGMIVPTTLFLKTEGQSAFATIANHWSGRKSPRERPVGGEKRRRWTANESSCKCYCCLQQFRPAKFVCSWNIKAKQNAPFCRKICAPWSS